MCIELFQELVECSDSALFNAVSYMELHHLTSQHLQGHEPLTPIAEQLRNFCIPQAVLTPHNDVRQDMGLGQENGYQTDFCKYMVNEDEIGRDEDAAGIDLDAESEQYSDMGNGTSLFATADERQIYFRPSYLSLGPDDVLSRTGRWIAQVKAENQPIETELLTEWPRECSGLTW